MTITPFRFVQTLVIAVHTIRTDPHRIVLEKMMLYLHTYCRSKILFTMSSEVLAQREEETRHFASTSFPAIYFSSMWDLRTSVSRDFSVVCLSSRPD